MLSLDVALGRVLEGASPLGCERVPLLNAQARTLAVPALAVAPLPGFDNSAMDGYAANTSDLLGTGPWELDVRGQSAAGSPADSLTRGTLCRIFTGAMIPPGADTVILQENTEGTASGKVRVLQAGGAGDHIRRRGENLATGETALSAGTLLDGFALGLLASIGHDQVTVYRKPRVAVICTGDELRLPSERERPGSIVESNGVAIASLVNQLGGDAHLTPLMPDSRDAITDAIKSALSSSDVIITIGGVSVGERDHVREALVAAGVELNFWKVAIRPGKPLTFGRRGATVALGLPGNPVSAQVTFCLFGAPLLRAMQGRSPANPELVATLTNTVRQMPGRRSFWRGRLTQDARGSRVTSLSQQGSGSVTSLANANALIIMPEDCETLEEGTDVRVLRLEDLCR